MAFSAPVLSDRVMCGSNDLVILDASIPVVDASGTLGTVVGNAIVSVTRNSAGNLTVQLQDRFCRVIGIASSFSGGTASDITEVNFTSSAVTDGKVVLICNKGTVATDPADGSILNVIFFIRRSSIKEKNEA